MLFCLSVAVALFMWPQDPLPQQSMQQHPVTIDSSTLVPVLSANPVVSAKPVSRQAEDGEQQTRGSKRSPVATAMFTSAQRIGEQQARVAEPRPMTTAVFTSVQGIADPDWYTEQQHDSGANLSIAGVVLNEDDQPLAGMSIDITPATTPSSPMSVTSDSDGAFSLSGLVAGEYRLRSREDAQHDRYLGRAFAGNESVKIVLKSLVPIVVRGRVHDRNSVPVAGVQVLLPNFNGGSLVTDEGGEFNKTVMLAKGASLSIQFRRDGYQRHRDQVNTEKLQPGEVVGFYITLQRGALTLSGQVIDDTHQPVPKASVSLYSRSTQMFANARSDDQGSFTINDLLPAEDYRLSVSSGGDYQQYERQNQSIGNDQTSLDIVLQSHGYGSFSGRIIDSHGNAIPSLKLLVKTHGVSGSESLTTDSNGEFFAARLAAGEVQVYSRGEIQIRAHSILLAAGQSLSQELIADAGTHRLYGTITDASGEPVPGARVILQIDRSYTSGDLSGSRRQAATGRDGDFEFDSLGNGARTLQVSAPGFARERLTIDPSTLAGPHVITLSPVAP